MTKDQITQEVDRVGFGHKIERVICEEKDQTYPDYQWTRVYFRSPEEADGCITQLTLPGRPWRWHDVVCYRLPTVGHTTGEIEGNPVFQGYHSHPPDTLAVDAQEGQVHFCTDEMLRTKGLIDFFEAKRTGRTIRRLICKHFDPEKRVICRYAEECNFLHVKAEFMNRLLRSVPHQQELRLAGREEDLQISSWEFSRRQDCLLIRDLESTMDLAGLKYMFEACAGFSQAFMRTTIDGGVRYGIVRFSDPATAQSALLQTFGSGLNISLWGVLEDIRTMQLREAKENPAYAAEHRRRIEARQEVDRAAAVSAVATGHGANQSTTTQVQDEDLPFPPLPDGWCYGLSRRKSQYYFYQTETKEKTTWKHPVTDESYHVGGASPR